MSQSKFTPGITNIEGVFDRQVWQNDNAVSIGETKFSATAQILRMPLAKIRALEDCSENTDQLGQQFVTHDGPCSVYITASIAKFFGVEDIKNINLVLLTSARKWYDELPKETFTITLKVSSLRRTIVRARDLSEATLKLQRQIKPGQQIDSIQKVSKDQN